MNLKITYRRVCITQNLFFNSETIREIFKYNSEEL